MKEIAKKVMLVILACSILIGIIITPTKIWSEEDIATVKIEYKYEDGSKAFDSYIARLQTGTDFKTHVQSPTIAGYSAYENGQSAQVVSLDYTNISADETRTVTYKPDAVDYSYYHFMQNVDDDGYVEGDNNTLKGEVGSIPKADIIAPEKKVLQLFLMMKKRLQLMEVLDITYIMIEIII